MYYGPLSDHKSVTPKIFLIPQEPVFILWEQGHPCWDCVHQRLHSTCLFHWLSYIFSGTQSYSVPHTNWWNRHTPSLGPPLKKRWSRQYTGYKCSSPPSSPLPITQPWIRFKQPQGNLEGRKKPQKRHVQIVLCRETEWIWTHSLLTLIKYFTLLSFSIHTY